MAAHFLTSIYGTPAGGMGGSGGVAYSFPVAGTLIYPANTSNSPNSANVFGSVTALSIVQVLPNGLNQKSYLFYSVDSVTTLNTACNA